MTSPTRLRGTVMALSIMTWETTLRPLAGAGGMVMRMRVASVSWLVRGRGGRISVFADVEGE
jgi:hypothetical protein